MKRRALNLIFAGAIALSAVSGLATLWANGPDLAEMAQDQLNAAPVKIAGAPVKVVEPAPAPAPRPAPGDASTNGSSWGG